MTSPKFRRALSLALLASLGIAPALPAAELTFSIPLPPIPTFGIHFGKSHERADDVDSEGFEDLIAGCVNTFVSNPYAQGARGLSGEMKNNLRTFMGKVSIHQVSGKAHGSVSYSCGHLTINYGIDRGKRGKCTPDELGNLFRPDDAQNGDFCQSKGLMKIVHEYLVNIAEGNDPHSSPMGHLEDDCASLVAPPPVYTPPPPPPPAQQCLRPVKPPAPVDGKDFNPNKRKRKDTDDDQESIEAAGS